MTNSIGRPKKELDWKVLDSILQFGATLIDCAEMCEMSDDSIQRRIKDEYGCTFTEYRNRKMSRMRVKLLQKQYESAMAGNTALLIWLGKQHLGQSDKNDISVNGDVAIKTLSLENDL
jgi:AraC-like DNA-binding protein